MRKLLTFLIACTAFVGTINAQLTGVTHEVYAVDGVAGFTTYRIFADLQDPTDFLSSVYAATNDYIHLGGTTGVIYNDGFGAITGDALNTAFCMFVPTLCYDSFVTIGWVGSNYYDGTPIACGQSTTTISSLPNASVIGNHFGTATTATNLDMQDGAWFTTNLTGCNDNGFGIGATNRILIAQVTIPNADDIEYNLNIQLFDEAVGAAPLYYVGDCLFLDGDDVLGDDGDANPNELDQDGGVLGCQYPFLDACPSVASGCMDSTACNYDSTATVDDGSCTYPGCNDSAACNYDSAAGCDDGSCCYDNCITITVGGGSFDSEISWELQDGLGNVVASGIAPESQDLCIVDDCYVFVMYDSFGDSWNGATYTIADGAGNTLYSGTHSGGSTSSANAGIPGACGCMDTTACNYDSAAVTDDGSCLYGPSNDDCANAIGVLVDGSTTLVNNVCATADGAAGTNWVDGSTENDVWYSFVAPAGGIVTIELTDDGTASLNDPQIALFDGCGGVEIDSDDDDGLGLYSLLVFDCSLGTGLVGGQTYYLSVDGYNGDEGTCNMTITLIDISGCTDSAFDNYDPCATIDDGGCTNDVPGCMDSSACNYDSAATADDGSCCFDNCIVITVGGGSFESEMSWELQDVGGATIASGAAPEVVDICLADGCYNFIMYDSFGDGWNGGSFSVDDNMANNYASGTITSGSIGNVGFGINTSCPSGCMDSGACNYDSTAVFDDGSCDYASCVGCTDSAACNYAGATIEDGSCCYDNCLTIDMIDSFGDGWNGATYDIVDAATSLSVASGSLAAGSLATDDLCLADGCYIITVGGGTFDSEISWVVNGADAPASGAAGTGYFSVNTSSCFGCMDSTACNYDGSAMYDDGSCTYPPCIANDEPAGAIALSVTPQGTCSSITADLSLAQSDNPEGTANTGGPSADLWYQFTAVTGGVRIELGAVAFDGVLEILDASFTSIDSEDVTFFGSDEYLNVGDLVPGDTYYISISAWGGTPGAGNGDFDLCVQYLFDTVCDMGAGPYNLCSVFKADWVGPAVYTFHFTGQTDFVTYSADGDPWDFIQFADVPGMPWGQDYDVLIDVKHMLTDGAGNNELPNVPGTTPCMITLNPSPTTGVLPSANCANHGPHYLGAYIGSTPWVCGAVDWEWTFTRTDVAELPIVHLAGTAVNYVRLVHVPGLTPGGTYDVEVRAVFANGSYSTAGPAECISIVGPVGPSMEGPVVEEIDEEKELGTVATPEAAIYPNPNDGQILNVNLSGVESNIVSLDITDMYGKLVLAQQITVNSGNVQEVINLNGLASGIYQVTFTLNDTKVTERLIVGK